MRVENDREHHDELIASRDMEPVEGAVEIDISAHELWEVFSRPRGWPIWNRCMTWVHNHDLELGESLVWAFEPVRPHYLYRMPATARIVELDAGRTVTWEVTAFPGMYARHTYEIVPTDEGSSRFRSWEQAMGPGFTALRNLWLAHFRFVCRESLAGVQRLEQVHRALGSLDGLRRHVG